MKIFVLGGHGRLGQRLVPLLAKAGHQVSDPTREQCDATNAESVSLFLESSSYDLVISLVGYTDVLGCDTNPDRALSENEESPKIVGGVCRDKSIPWVWISTDYVVPAAAMIPAGTKPIFLDQRAHDRLHGEYASSKAFGEENALTFGATVARVAFCCPEDAEKWTWVDGYNIASREWVEQTAERLALLAPLAAKGWNAGKVVNVGPIVGVDDVFDEDDCGSRLGLWRTRDQLLRDRFPDHPALKDIVRSPSERFERGGGYGPSDTRFARCAPELALVR